ncbi:MAG: RNA 2',3'-cyclic phosphodiesterase [Nanoarchaeota archaeon]
MRLFVGIFLSKEIIDYLYEVQNNLKKNLNGKINWIAKSKLHFTLKFLGEVKENRLNEIKERLNKIKFKSFKVKLDKIGVFPNEDHARVIWTGLSPKEKAIELQKQVDSELLDIFSKDQEFNVHITLARVKLIKDKEEFNKNLKIDIEEKELEINEFCLVRSILTKDGSKYEILEKFKLI